MKNYFAQKILLRNLRMCELLANGIGIRSFLDDVEKLEDLTNMEEQGKSFLRRSLFINRTQSHKIKGRSGTRFAFELEPRMKKNCDAFTHSYDFCIVSTRHYDFFIVLMT